MEQLIARMRASVACSGSNQYARLTHECSKRCGWGSAKGTFRTAGIKRLENARSYRTGERRCTVVNLNERKRVRSLRVRRDLTLVLRARCLRARGTSLAQSQGPRT